MATSNKLQQLLDQKAKIEEQLQIETDKRFIQVGKIARQANILHWDNKTLANAFKFLADQGSEEFKSK